MKKILIATITFLFIVKLQAQTKIGIQAGAIGSISTITGTPEVSTWELDKISGKSKASIGYRVGAFFEVPLLSNLYLTPELNYVHKEGKFSGEYPIGASNIIYYTRSIKTNYIELPLNISYKTGGTKGSFLFGVGPVLGMGISGRHLYDVYRKDPTVAPYSGDQQIEFDGKNESDPNTTHFNKFEYGANVSAGYTLNNGLRLCLQFRPNFNDTNPDKNATYKNTYLGLNLGFVLK